MAQQHRRGQLKQGGASDADLAHQLGLLDWEGLDPIVEGGGEAGTRQEIPELGFLLGDELMQGDEPGSDDDTAASHDDVGSLQDGDHMRGGSSSSIEKAAQRAPVVTTGLGTQIAAQGSRALPSVTTGAVASRRGTKRSRAAARVVSASPSGSSGSGNQAQGTSAEPTDPSGSADSRGKRRKAAPDLSAIEDPAERRKQRRLAKNRATAAVSRERKRVQMVQLAARTRALEQDNANLQFMLGLRDSEIQRLRGELASLPRGVGLGPGDADAVATSPTEPAALTGVALPLAATLQQLCLRAPRHSRAALSLLACILFFLALTSVGNPPSQPHPFWAPVSPSLSPGSSPGEIVLDWGAPMAWGWPFLLRLAAARRRRQRPSRPPTAATAHPPATGWELGGSSPTHSWAHPSSWGATGLQAPLPSWEDPALLLLGGPEEAEGTLAPLDWEALAGPPGSPGRRASWDILPILAPLQDLPPEQRPAGSRSSSSSSDQVLLGSPMQCAASSTSSGSSRPLSSTLPHSNPQLLSPSQLDTSSPTLPKSRTSGASSTLPAAGAAADGTPRAETARQRTLSRSAQKQRAAQEAAAQLAASGMAAPCTGPRAHHKVARGLPILPPVPMSAREAKRRSAMALLPLGMALLAAQSFVEQRLYSADICKNVIEG